MKKIFSIFLIIWFLFIWKAFADVKPIEKVNLSIDSIETTNIKAETTSIKAENTNLEIPNPASVNCIENGGTSKIMEGKDWQYSLCVFENGTSCEEWAFLREECKNEKEYINENLYKVLLKQEELIQKKVELVKIEVLEKASANIQGLIDTTKLTRIVKEAQDIRITQLVFLKYIIDIEINNR